MSYLINTHILLWTLMDTSKLSKNIFEVYSSGKEVQVSNLSFWEISLKYGLGKLDLDGLTPSDVYQAAKDSNFKVIDISAEIMATVHELPKENHKDPFDRMLIWHAINAGLILISHDTEIKHYQSHGLRLLN